MRAKVIEILSDTEEDEEMKAKQLQILQKQLELEAALTKSNTNMMLAVNMKFLQGTASEKKATLVERIKKMFIDKFKIDASKQHFCLPRDPDQTLPNFDLIRDEVMIFGADFWTSTQIRQQAKNMRLGDVEVTKLDDSHKKIKFINEDMAKKWISWYSKDKIKFDAKVEEEADMQVQTELSKEQPSKLRGWFELQPYKFQDFTRVRRARFCLKADGDLKGMIEDTKTTSYVKFKQALENQLLRDPKVEEEYNQVTHRSHRRRYHHHGYIDDRSYRRDRETLHRRSHNSENQSYYSTGMKSQYSYRNQNRGDQSRCQLRTGECRGYDYSNRSGYDRGGHQHRRDESRREDRSRMKKTNQVNKMRDEQRNNYRGFDRPDLNRTILNETLNMSISTSKPQQKQQKNKQNQIQNQDNFEFLLDEINKIQTNNNNDLSIANALNKMKLQDGMNQINDMSIDIGPPKTNNNSSIMQADMSIMQTTPQQKQLKQFKQLKQRQREKRQKKERRERDRSERRDHSHHYRNRSRDQRPTRAKQTWSYLSYIQQSEQEAEKERVERRGGESRMRE